MWQFEADSFKRISRVETKLGEQFFQNSKMMTFDRMFLSIMIIKLGFLFILVLLKSDTVFIIIVDLFHQKH